MLINDRIQLRNYLFNEFERLKLIYRNKMRIYKNNNFYLLLSKYDDLYNKYKQYISEFRTENEALYCLMHNDDFSNHLCPVCNNVCGFYHTNKRNEYKHSCGSQKCITGLNQSDKAKEKRLKTNLKKYKVENPFQAEIYKEKARNTKKQKYNDKNYNNRTQAKQTCLDRYKVENPAQLTEIQEKMRETRQQLYNNPNYNNRILFKQTCLDRYGINHPSKIDFVKNKMRETYYKNHTILNLITNNDVYEFINNYKIESQINYIDVYINNEYFKEFIEYEYIKKNRYLSLEEISNIFNIGINSIKRRLIELNLLKYFYIQNSKLELKFENFLKNNNIKYKYRDRLILKPREIDFLLLDYNVGFEINDLCSHNIIKKNNKYHLSKTLECQSKNIQLIHIWEWELTDENLWNKLQNWIINILSSQKNQININDCKIKLIDKTIEKSFLNNYSMNEYCESDICIGLYYDNELVHIMSFIKSSNNDYILLENCTKFNFTIKEINQIIDLFKQIYKVHSLIVRYDISKYSSQFYELNKLELYKKEDPYPIWYINNKNDHNWPSHQIYNCGEYFYFL